jgi:hypothetical protein
MARPAAWSDLVDYVLWNLVPPEMEIFFTMAWMIWGARNYSWLNKPRSEAIQLGVKAVTYAEEFREANQRPDSSNIYLKPKWILPSATSFKLNVAWQRFKARDSLGVGAIIRDHSGALMAAYSEEFSCEGDGLLVAAVSLKKALTFGHEAGFTHLSTEFSHPQLQSLLSSNEECLTELADILSLLKGFSNVFYHLEFSSIPRSCNKAARLLANYAQEIQVPSIWIEEGLAILLPIVLEELS